ncbi:hypothetical protein [Serratia marcescens]|uniref:hypothetical protein n=1 Tax=Serratia marcescens TaxID=615 RepID=UPI0011F20853|nr:hypothetical protein [Serratia marcescens]
MTFSIVRAPKYYVMYRTADQVSRVKNDLAGSFSYYAEAQDALDSGLFCQKILSPVWGSIYDKNPSDFLGKRFRIIRTESLTPEESALLPEHSALSGRA